MRCLVPCVLVAASCVPSTELHDAPLVDVEFVFIPGVLDREEIESIADIEIRIIEDGIERAEAFTLSVSSDGEPVLATPPTVRARNTVAFSFEVRSVDGELLPIGGRSDDAEVRDGGVRLIAFFGRLGGSTRLRERLAIAGSNPRATAVDEGVLVVHDNYGLESSVEWLDFVRRRHCIAGVDSEGCAFGDVFPIPRLGIVAVALNGGYERTCPHYGKILVGLGEESEKFLRTDLYFFDPSKTEENPLTPIGVEVTGKSNPLGVALPGCRVLIGAGDINPAFQSTQDSSSEVLTITENGVVVEPGPELAAVESIQHASTGPSSGNIIAVGAFEDPATVVIDGTGAIVTACNARQPSCVRGAEELPSCDGNGVARIGSGPRAPVLFLGDTCGVRFTTDEEGTTGTRVAPLDSLKDAEVAPLGETVIAIGGKNRSTFVTSSQISVLDGDGWVEFGTLLDARSEHSVVSIGTAAVAVGGYCSECFGEFIFEVDSLEFVLPP